MRDISGLESVSGDEHYSPTSEKGTSPGESDRDHAQRIRRALPNELLSAHCDAEIDTNSRRPEQRHPRLEIRDETLLRHVRAGAERVTVEEYVSSDDAALCPSGTLPQITASLTASRLISSHRRSCSCVCANQGVVRYGAAVVLSGDLQTTSPR
jgi:hypothetical protein